MIREQIDIEPYDWRVWVYYAVDCYYTREIAEQLQRIGCDGAFLSKAERNMACGNINHGLTYSNTRTGESVVVVGIASSAEQFLNSLSHELFHLTCHICEARGIPTQSEEAAYLMGDTMAKCYNHTRQLIYDNTQR